MPIRQFELYHGAVLVHLVRQDKPMSIRLVEANSEDWSIYTLDGETDLFVTYRRSGRSLTRSPGASWQFVFNSNQLRQLSGAGRGRPVFAALVCAVRDGDAGDSRVCLLSPEEIQQALDLEATTSAITIQKPDGGKFRVVKDRKEVFKVAESRFMNWNVSG